MFHIFSLVCFLIYGVNRRQVLIAKPLFFFQPAVRGTLDSPTRVQGPMYRESRCNPEFADGCGGFAGNWLVARPRKTVDLYVILGIIEVL